MYQNCLIKGIQMSNHKIGFILDKAILKSPLNICYFGELSKKCVSVIISHLISFF